MKRNLQLLAGLLMLAGLLPGCSSADGGFMQRVETDFRHKRELLSRGDLFRVFDGAMTPQERDAMTFLYAYMPVGDITDYPGDFYLENVRCALSVRQEMSWGRSVSDELFRHFVLPVRVNNECLDDSRRVFHDELKPRVEGLSMYDAVLEVNHWCHEKANYQPSDARTSSPLATVRTAYGRCGEESTLLVAALRSVGIPARQVYTPRWAHTDDNHAWVEAWADGRWHFLGACEPEPVLDLGWFNAPASRGMLMHTKVFGYYDGPEEVMKTTANYTEINVISNYAACAPLTVTVTDTAGSPVEGATVEFKLYNYAEFYTVSRKTSDVRGRASLSAGLGDMLVTAVCDGRFGVRKVSFGRETEATVVLEHAIGDEFSFPVDIVPRQPDPASGALHRLHDHLARRRLAQPDSRQTFSGDLLRCRGPFARHPGVDRPCDRQPFLSLCRKGCARRFRRRREPGTGDRTDETELCADSASRRSGVFPALLPFALRRTVVLPAELS